MKISQIGMSQCLDDVDSFFRVEHQQFLQQVDSIWVSKREQFVEILAVLLILRQVFD